MIGVVLVGIDSITEQGQVKVDGEVWSAKSQDGSSIEEGSEVKIIDISGVRVVATYGPGTQIKNELMIQ